MKYALLILALWAAGCARPDQSRTEEVPVLPDRKLTAAFLVVDGTYNTELVAPMDVLQHTVFHMQHGIDVFTVAPSRDTVTTFEGLRIVPDYGFTTDSIPPVDLLIVPSARQSMDADLANEALIDFVRTRGREALYVMSLCDGAFVLAQAGLLDAHVCTTFPADVERFRETFPDLAEVREGLSFVHDRTVITSQGGARSFEAALYLVELLYGRDIALKIGTGLVIEWDLASVPHYRTPY
jgi:transcriptional regulator GlxA family with amidase domain